jgi:hypothetical protein
MKKECDANGLEYEVLMKESAKERFLREIKGNSNALDINKHLVILKQKRQSATSTTEPVVAAPAPSDDPVVAAAQNSSSDGDIVGAPHAAGAIAGKAAIAGLTAPKLLIQLRERFGGIGAGRAGAGAGLFGARAGTGGRLTLPALPALPSLPSPAPVRPAPGSNRASAPAPSRLSLPTIPPQSGNLAFPTFPPLRALPVQPSHLH